MNTPKISVVMPVYNAVDYMEKSINSILNQTFRDFELICVNDCSLDNSLEKLKEFQGKDSRIKIIENLKNSGPGISRNFGIKKAKGEFVCFVDSDDWLEIDSFELLYNKLKKEKADVIFIKPKFVFTNKTILDRRLLKKKDYSNKEKVLRATMKRKIAWAPWSKMVRRDLLIKNKIFFPNIYVAEDMDFSIKSIYYAKKIIIENKYLYNYYLHEGSLTSYKNAERRINNYFESAKLMKKFLKEKKLFEKYKKDFIYFKYYNYLASYGVLENTKETFDKLKYKKIIRNDPDFKLSKIFSLKYFDSVIIGVILIKLNLFSVGLKVWNYFRKIFGKWGNRN